MGCYFRVGNSGISQHLIYGVLAFLFACYLNRPHSTTLPPYVIKKMKHRKPQRHPFSHKK